jgi:hypothetical protein
VQNSEEVMISDATVFAIIDAFSPDDNSLVAACFAFFAFSKKYFTFFLCIISSTTPAITNITIAIKNACIAIEGIVAPKSENGL